MAHTWEIIRTVFSILIPVVVFGGLIVLTIIKSEDPARMTFKWVLTLIVFAIMVFKVAPMVGQGGYGAAFGGIPFAAVCGITLAIIWRRTIASWIADPIGSLYDGGTTAPDPHPAYSIAQSRQKQGKYLQAIAEIQKQLEKFPTDFEGHMMMAEIQADDLNDLAASEATIQRLCAQPGHAPRNIAFALYSMADWYLAIGKDREAAQRILEQVSELLPNSEFSLGAAQRIAHLADREMLMSSDDRRKLILKEGVQNIGLLAHSEHFKPTETDPGLVATEYVKHLEQHPLDTEAREKLAVIYADHYHRLDMATDELEQLIQQPNQPSRLVVRWLNLLADLQIREGADYETARATIQRIIDRDPKAAPANLAQNRLATLRLELKAQQKNQAVKLGSYEQNIGLKQGLPHRR
jgi:tetratricopeptide (TPR) repeat protein